MLGIPGLPGACQESMSGARQVLPTSLSYFLKRKILLTCKRSRYFVAISDMFEASEGI
jgi:hypothetical protein